MDAKTFSSFFRISEAAKKKILAGSGARGLKNEVVTIARATASGQSNAVWGVAFMSQGDLPEDEVSAIRGLRVFVDAQWRAELQYQQLDVRNGSFALVPRAGE